MEFNENLVGYDVSIIHLKGILDWLEHNIEEVHEFFINEENPWAKVGGAALGEIPETILIKRIPKSEFYDVILFKEAEEIQYVFGYVIVFEENKLIHVKNRGRYKYSKQGIETFEPATITSLLGIDKDCFEEFMKFNEYAKQELRINYLLAQNLLKLIYKEKIDVNYSINLREVDNDTKINLESDCNSMAPNLEKSKTFTVAFASGGDGIDWRIAVQNNSIISITERGYWEH
jgi:hypothetical protein